MRRASADHATSPGWPQATREPVWAVTAPLLDLAVRLLADVRVVGAGNIPRTGPALLAANHVSHFDPVVLLVVTHRAGRRLRFLTVQEAFDRPVSGWLLRAGRHIPVGTGSTRLAAVRLARAALAAGEVVLVYPEGTIPHAAEVAGAKAGAGLLAVTSGVPVLPVATRGLERGAGPRWRRRRATVVFGDPVDVSDLAGDAAGRGRARYEEASTRILEAVRQLTRTIGVR